MDSHPSPRETQAEADLASGRQRSGKPEHEDAPTGLIFYWIYRLISSQGVVPPCILHFLLHIQYIKGLSK